MSDNQTNIDITNQISTQKPIQVRKVSALQNYSEYRNNTQTPLYDSGAYILVGYPGHKHDAPHNFKVSIDDITQFAYTYITPIFDSKLNDLSILFKNTLDNTVNELTEYYNKKFEYLLEYIKAFHADKPDISAQWSIYEPYIKQYWNKETIDEDDYNVVLPDLSELQ